MRKMIIGMVVAILSLLGATSAMGAFGVTDSVSVQLLTPPQGFTETIKVGQTSMISADIGVTANCRATSLDEWIDVLDADTNIYVRGMGGDQNLRSWLGACDGPDYPEGTTWTEVGPVFSHDWQYRLTDRGTISYEPFGVEFVNKQAVAQIKVKRIKTWTKKVTKAIRIRYTRKVWDYQFDRYINICLNGTYRLYASGGHLYCNAQFVRTVRKKVKVITKAAVRWTVTGLPSLNSTIPRV
jgi:hypothetical protein